MKLYLGVMGVFVATCSLLALGACTDDTGTGTTSSSSSSGSSGDMTSSSGSSSGSSGMTSSSSSGSSGMTSSSSSSSTSSSGYTICSECTSNTKGAYVKECKTQQDACIADPECLKLATCSYDTCSTDAAGGACSQKCATDLNTPMASKALFCTLDDCVFCKTCTTLCDPGATDYCAVTKTGVCKP